MNGALAAPKGVKAARHAPTLGGGGLEWAQRLARESPELATTFRGFLRTESVESSNLWRQARGIDSRIHRFRVEGFRDQGFRD